MRSTSPVNSEILDRLPSHDLDAEKAVVGSMLMKPEIIDEISLQAEDFYSDANATLYRHLRTLWENGAVDATLLASHLREVGELENVGGTAYIAEVTYAVGAPGNAIAYAKIVAAHAV